MTQIYVPSGRYAHNAPIIFCAALFLTMSLCGLCYGFFISHISLISDFGRPIRLDLPLLIGILIICIFIGTTATEKLIINLRIRAPVKFQTLAIVVSLLGWSLNWASLYKTSKSINHIDIDFINFIIDRLKNGVPLYIYMPFSFHIQCKGFLLILGWILESAIPIWFINKAVSYQASYPFSETLDSWYLCMELTPEIGKPNPKEIIDCLDKGDISCLLAAEPYRPSWKEEGERFFRNNTSGRNKLAIYWESQGKMAFITLCPGGRAKLVHVFGRISWHLNIYWSISAAEAERIAKLWGKSLP